MFPLMFLKKLRFACCVCSVYKCLKISSKRRLGHLVGQKAQINDRTFGVRWLDLPPGTHGDSDPCLFVSTVEDFGSRVGEHCGKAPLT